MKTARQEKPARATASKPARLRARLAVAEATLRAIRSGEVDSVMVAGKEGSQVFTLDGAEHAYRVLIESMNEGALMLTPNKTILYANQCFARMVGCPLEQVIGSSLRRFLSAADRAVLRPLLKRADQSGSKIQMRLDTGGGSSVPVQISIRLLAKEGFRRTAIGMVVTDMTEARRIEELLRSLTQRVVQAQEAERGRVAIELHDHITQLLCAVLVRSQTLADKLPAREEPLKREAIKLRELLGHAAEEVERISGNLRPGLLEHLGLATVLHNTVAEFAKRTGVAVKLAGAALPARLPAEMELTFYRILQEALKNIEQHARAGHVSVGLTKPGNLMQLAIKDDGIGFNPKEQTARQNGKLGLGLIGLRERVAYLDGTLIVKSAPGKGTTIQAQIPLIDVPRGGGGRRNSSNRTH